MKVPVVIVENPKGYMDQVITYKYADIAYVEVHPWMFASLEDPDSDDLHDKITHLFSGGSSHAIQEHPLQNYLTRTERTPDVEKNWVLHIQGVNASNLRSKTPPGMALGMAACAIDRYLCYMKMHCGYVSFEYHRSKLLKTPDKNERCNRPLSNGRLCNLRHGHRDSIDNHKRGLGNECGIFCYASNKYLYTEPLFKDAKRVCCRPKSDISSARIKIVYENMTAGLARKVAKRDPVQEYVENNGNIHRIYKFYKFYTYYENADTITWRKLM